MIEQIHTFQLPEGEFSSKATSFTEQDRKILATISSTSKICFASLITSFLSSLSDAIP